MLFFCKILVIRTTYLTHFRDKTIIEKAGLFGRICNLVRADLQSDRNEYQHLLFVTFCLQRQKVTKERRRRCILAKNHFTTLNSRGWLPPQANAAKPRVLNASFKDFLHARLQSRNAIVT